MGEVELSPEQLAFGCVIAEKLKIGGYVLLSYDIFGQHFGCDQTEALKFVLSTNAWRMKLDEVLQLVVVTHDPEGKVTWPIADLKRQVVDMQRRGTQEEDRR